MNFKILGIVDLVIESKKFIIENKKQRVKGKGNTMPFLILNNSFIGNTKLNHIQRIVIDYNCKIKGK